MNKASVNVHVQIFMCTNSLWNGLSISIGLSALLHSPWVLWHRFQDSYSSSCHFPVAYVSGRGKLQRWVVFFKSNSPAVAHITACSLWSELGDMAGNFKESEFFFCLGLMYQTRNSYYVRRRKCKLGDHIIVIFPQLLLINKFLVTINMYMVTFT